MRIHDDRPGGAGGSPDDRSYGAHAQRPRGGKGAAKSTQGLNARQYNYYDEDDGYSASEATSLVGGVGEDSGYAEELGKQRKPFGWNGGTDLGLLVLRLALGGVFLLHGAQKLFGAFGGPGPEGFAEVLSDKGFQQSAALSLVTGGTELGTGALLVLGLFTPAAAAGVVGLMASAVFVNLGSGFFNAEGGFEMEAILGAVGIGLLFTGPGRVALDYGRVWFRRPLGFGFFGLIIAAGAAAAVLILFHRP
ncbi:DoxX family protein [Saccharopolyspora rhizosphaerae]|uniref:DoxX family protein n=1 Tax=Saccharopolyspora rhizosphaerae TaxID=2492662 RepID=A0A426JSY2_9PSEU|nr:DoxX family protein [Saccharopolyspora rhizosphaerae]RRO16290.1 DoxX family protein [Saccharopolyspora rhizosphaerae]